MLPVVSWVCATRVGRESMPYDLALFYLYDDNDTAYLTIQSPSANGHRNRIKIWAIP